MGAPAAGAQGGAALNVLHGLGLDRGQGRDTRAEHILRKEAAIVLAGQNEIGPDRLAKRRDQRPGRRERIRRRQVHCHRLRGVPSNRGDAGLSAKAVGPRLSTEAWL